MLIEIADRTSVKMIFFIDVGYLKKLDEYKTISAVGHQRKLVREQIAELIDKGHDCQLHIHPHWEDTIHDGTQWIMKTDRYKLADFKDEEARNLVLEYKKILESWTGQKVHSYRAGGWCLQPFSQVRDAFLEAGIKYDSTVFPGGKFTAGNYYYDYTSAPDLSSWKFENDLVKIDENGSFTEIPISSQYYSPLFFSRLFFLGRYNPKAHKPMGDGYPMPSPGLRKKMLTQGMKLSASCDGYFVTKMDEVLERNIAKGFSETVYLGHPKACTFFALQKLEEFILRHRNNHRFVTFNDLILETAG